MDRKEILTDYNTLVQINNQGQLDIYEKQMSEYGYFGDGIQFARDNFIGNGIRYVSLSDHDIKSYRIYGQACALYPSYISYTFDQIFGNIKTFKTEAELVEYVKSKNLYIICNSVVEFGCCWQLLERNKCFYYSDKTVEIDVQKSYDSFKTTKNGKTSIAIDIRNNYELYWTRTSFKDLTYIDFEELYGMLE